MRVLVNAAMSADGKLSTRRRDQISISGPEDFTRVDRVRSDSDAVMVGIGTVLADDPSLTVDEPDLVAARKDRGDPPQPSRVIADSQARTPTDAGVLDDAAPTYVLVTEAAPEGRIADLEVAGAVVVVAGDEQVDLPTALSALEQYGMDRLLVEGGGEILFSLFDEGLVDELSVYVGSIVIGGRDAPTLADGEGFVDAFPELSLASADRIDDGVLLRWTVSESARSPRRT